MNFPQLSLAHNIFKNNLHRDRVRYGKSYLNQDSPKCIVIIGKPECAILRGPLLDELFKGSLQTQPPFLLYLTVGPCSADLQKTLESEVCPPVLHF